MSNYIIYNSKGEILKNISCPPSLISIQIMDQEHYLEHELVNDDEFYVVNGEVVPRPTFSESISGTTISNLPIPTTITTNGNSYTITDGSAELSFSLPGTYKVYLSSFPYQDKVVEVTQV